jgi:phage tail-like protein
MARARNTDFYQSFTFHVVEEGGYLNPAAGFNTATLPDVTVETAEYREGIRTWTYKQPAFPTVDNITLTRGVSKKGTDFYNWVMTVVEGNEAYRTDLELWHFHGTDQRGLTGSPSRVYRLLEAYPTRVKLAADFDANATDISIEEIEMACEKIEVKQLS